jgi:hypothetical protein
MNFKTCPTCKGSYTASVCPVCQGKAGRSPEIGGKRAETGLEIVESPETDIEPPNAYDGPEKDLHRDFIADMNRRGVHLVYARTDKESTIGNGLPDFHCMSMGTHAAKACAVEFKRKGGKPSPKQREVIAEMRRKDIPVIVAWNLADAINFCREYLGC